MTVYVVFGNNTVFNISNTTTSHAIAYINYVHILRFFLFTVQGLKILAILF